MKQLLIPFVVILLLLPLGCEENDPDPSENQPRLSSIIVDDVGKEYYRYDFKYEDGKLVEIEQWYNDRYWHDNTTDNWEKGSRGIVFYWNGEVLSKIVWNYRTSSQTLEFDYELAGNINITRTRVYYDLPTDVEQRTEEWEYDQDKLQRIIISDDYHENPDIYNLTWTGNEITQVYKSGDYEWKWLIENGIIESPFREIIPLKFRQLFLFHHDCFYDYDEILIWSNQFTPLRIIQVDMYKPGETNEIEITEGFSFESNPDGTLAAMQVEEVRFEFQYE